MRPNHGYPTAPSRPSAGGKIDGDILPEIDGRSDTNSGCVLDDGYIAIRAMLPTTLLIRNLKIHTERLPFEEFWSCPPPC